MGELFGTDPIRLLDCTEEEWLIRVACALVISEDRKRQAEEAEKQRNS
jgi:hypothetical protein